MVKIIVYKKIRGSLDNLHFNAILLLFLYCPFIVFNVGPLKLGAIFT